MGIGRVVIGMSGLAIVSALVTSCINDVEPSSARVVVEAEPASPLLLVVSKVFDVVASGEDEEDLKAVPLTADTVSLTGDFNETFDITAFRRIYVQVRNDEETPETVRVRVYLDGELFFDSTDRIADGGDVEYFYTSHSFR